MNYEFPVLTLESVREAIAGRPEFVEANRGDHIIFNYNVAFEDSFDCPIRRECRGLVFSPEGEILARRFHKFFNMNEREETQFQVVSSKIWNNAEHHVLEKLDGSMITPIILNGVVRWGTKMGLTDVAQYVENWIKPKYNKFAEYCADHFVTPIFEYVGPYNRIVLSYQEENMILLAMRHNISGEYVHYESMNNIAGMFDIPVVKKLVLSLDEVKSQTNMEGIVITFEDGHRVKVKSDWYVQIHKAKDNLLHEKNVISMFVNNELDDVYPHLMFEDRQKIQRFTEDFQTGFQNEHRVIFLNMRGYKLNEIDRKTFALTEAKKYNPFTRSIMFKLWDHHLDQRELQQAIYDNMLHIVKSKLGSQTSVEELRNWFYFKEWSY